MDKEPCAGCGEMSDDHSIVGIASEDGIRENRCLWAAFPICAKCHVDPSHRKCVLKMHFFPREMRAVALAHAGSSSIG